ncbi:sterol carrier family protein [Nocardioides sp.]|uniref:sterol carrier family protein n=1 Tax=Nocardioides sp. TaxID=35761 RepID=UPI0035185368
MPARLRPLSPADLARARTTDDRRALVKHYLAVLAERTPGASVEVRVPPYAAVQCVPGVRHTRGTPPAVVEMGAEVWVALATGCRTWQDALDAGEVRASGERADLAPWLPLDRPAPGHSPGEGAAAG